VRAIALPQMAKALSVSAGRGEAGGDGSSRAMAGVVLSISGPAPD